MVVELKEYKPEYIEKQVKLGAEIMENWRYNSQSSKEHLEKVYSQDNFQPKYRIYAFEGDDLVGFQTSHLLEEDGVTYGRIEFPLSTNKNVIDLLYKETETRFIDENAKFLRVRVSPHWGNTQDLAKYYNFNFEKDNLMTAETDKSKLKTLEVNPEDKSLISVLDGPKGRDGFNQVFPKRFPMRYEGEIDKWFQYYKEQEPLVWNLVTDDTNVPIGHIIGFKQDHILKLTSLFSIEKNQSETLQLLLSSAIEQVESINEITKFVLAIGDDQIKYANAINELGFDLKSQISFFTKNLD